MNTMTKTFATIVLSCATIAFAQAHTEVVAADSEAGTKLCVTAANGSTLQMGKAIKSAKISKRYITNEMTCNDQNIIAFIEAHGKNSERMTRFLTGNAKNDGLLISKVDAVL